MKKNTVFILGDSTSMTIGCERHMYPFIMANCACWPAETEIVNSSQPGFTSADACAFFFRHRKEFPLLKAVIINLGTCDAASSENRKERYSPFKQNVCRLQESIGSQKKRTRLKNRLLHYEWNNGYDPAIEAPESVDDYEYNLSRIMTACAASSIPVILIKPKANRKFLPGTGKGNFLFYRYMGIREKISTKLSISDERFRSALHLQEAGDLRAAMLEYREILLNAGSLSSHGEYPLIIVNNHAVCLAEQRELKEAEFLLSLLLKERHVRREIVTFNLAQLYKMRGDEDKYNQLLADSSEIDSSMYRIRSPYLDVIDRLSRKHGQNTLLIDMAAFIEDRLYVDHTHPLKEGQAMIADRVMTSLAAVGISGSNQADVRNILYNPELALGNTEEFYTYFRTYEPFAEEVLSEEIVRLRNALARENTVEKQSALLQELPKELKTAMELYLTHPCFPAMRYIIPFGPQYPSDAGRFPEFFLVRHLIPYLRIYEKEDAFRGQFNSEGCRILRTVKELVAMLPANVIPLVSSEDPVVDRVLESQRLPVILEACRKTLHAHLQSGNQVYERMKTTIFWYFRETLRFGSHSRFSMRYDRIILEYVAEALVVASLLNRWLDANQEREIKRLIAILEKIVCIHEDCSSEFSLSSEAHLTLAAYDRRLQEVAAKI